MLWRRSLSPGSMSRRKPHAAVAGSPSVPAAAAALNYGGLLALLLSACCLPVCEGFAPPLKLSSSTGSFSNTRAASRRPAMSREACSGACLLSRRGGWAARRGPVAAATLSPAGLLAAAEGGATATTAVAAAAASAGAAEFQDPLDGGSDALAAVMEEVSEEKKAKAAPTKKKAAPRKKVRAKKSEIPTDSVRKWIMIPLPGL